MLHEVFTDARRRFALKEQPVNHPNNLGFLLVDDWNTALATVIAQKMFEGHCDLAVSKTFPLPPGDILGDTPAFFLGKAGHNGNQQFALTVKGVNVFFFKENLHMMLLQLTDGDQAVDRISGKSADRLGDDEVDFPGEGICDHLIENLAAFGVRAGNTLIGIDLDELPIVPLFDVLRVVVDLGLITGELFIAVGGNTSVCCDPSFCNGCGR